MVHFRLVRIRNCIHSPSSQNLPDRIAVFQSNGTLYKIYDTAGITVDALFENYEPDNMFQYFFLRLKMAPVFMVSSFQFKDNCFSVKIQHTFSL